jgi:TPR repeat protein
VDGHTSSHPFLAICLYAVASRSIDEAGRRLRPLSMTWAATSLIERAESARGARNVDELHELGWMFARGRGVVKDPGAAASCFAEAARRGHARAQRAVARMLMVGEGIPRDMATAIHWLRQSGDERLLDAALRLRHLIDAQVTVDGGSWLGASSGVADDAAPKPRFDAAQARRLVAAEHADRPEYEAIGRMFEEGKGLPQSEVDAIYWYSRASARDDWPGRSHLARVDGLRSKLPVDGRLSEGAEYGDAEHLFAVGNRYLYGKGVTQDKAEAALWFAKATVRGSTEALLQLQSRR